MLRAEKKICLKCDDIQKGFFGPADIRGHELRIAYQVTRLIIRDFWKKVLTNNYSVKFLELT